MEDFPRLADLFPAAAGLGTALLASGRTVAVAESCTGGLLGAVLTAVPGSSGYVRGGVIAYANEVKTRLLGVSEELIAKHGAVSQEVALAMAAGARSTLGADLGIGITGVAGPGGEEGGKPAGLIFVALVDSSVERVRRLESDHGREANRAGAVSTALAMVAAAL